jgi:hypothetical protein
MPLAETPQARRGSPPATAAPRPMPLAETRVRSGRWPDRRRRTGSGPRGRPGTRTPADAQQHRCSAHKLLRPRGQQQRRNRLPQLPGAPQGVARCSFSAAPQLTASLQVMEL